MQTIHLKKIVSTYELPEVSSDSYPLKFILQIVLYLSDNDYGIEIFRKDTYKLIPSYLNAEIKAKLPYADEEIIVDSNTSFDWHQLRFDSEETALNYALTELVEQGYFKKS